MKKVVFVIFFITGICVAQEEITMNIGDFHTLKTYRGLQVELKKGETPKVVIDGKRSSEVTVKNVNGVLKVSLSITHTFSADDVMIYLYYANNIDVIDANEGSHIYSDEQFKQTKMVAKAQEAAQITLDIDTEQLDVNTVTGGIVKLKGKSVNQNVKSNTGGIYKGEELETENSNVSANTGGIASIKASKFADVSASTGGMITVLGDPVELKKSESLGGYVKQ